MNGEVCCILGVCCPPESQAQIDALAHELATDGVVLPEQADAVAAWVLKHFDLAPAKSLAHLKGEIARMARKG